MILTGPSQKVDRGSTAELTCLAMTKQHYPAWFKMVNDQDLNWIFKAENISLPNGEWHMGYVVPIRNVSSDDAGNYTCEAVWENPDYTRTAVYTIEVACKYLNNR